MSTERSDAIAARIARISAEVTRMRIGTQTAYATDFVTSQVTFFILTGSWCSWCRTSARPISRWW